MGLDVDNEILEDFLVEAGEILELLSEQLVDLEKSPDDKDLLNAIFRGFHTVKGGAGFLQLEAMVECCHKAENLFDLLRNGEVKITSDLMDVVLQSLDTLNSMFDDVRGGQSPSPAAPSLLSALQAYCEGRVPDAAGKAAPAAPSQPIESAPEPAPVAAPKATPAPVAKPAAGSADDEFDMLLNDVAPLQEQPVSDDLITEDEFESLLNELHGENGAPGMENDTSSPQVSEAASSDLITDDEFESLLDDLQAQGQGAFAQSEAPSEEAPAQPIESSEPSLPVSTASAPAPQKNNHTATPAERNGLVETRLPDKIMKMIYWVKAVLKDVGSISQHCEKLVLSWTKNNTLSAKVEIIIDELLNNIIEHGYKFDETARIVFEFRLVGSKLYITMWDKGIDWVPETVKYNHDNPYLFEKDLFDVSGRGLYMVLSWSEEFYRNRYSEELNETIVVLDINR